MKHILFTILCLATLCVTAQHGTINGKITDAEDDNNPLHFVQVSIKETGTKVMTDAQGAFTFKTIKNGTYTLVCSFTGYDTKEIITEVSSKPLEEIKLAMSASSLSLDDLAMAFASSNKNKNTTTNN